MAAQHVRRRRVVSRPHTAVAWMLVVATMVICLVATSRVRQQPIQKAGRIGARSVVEEGEHGGGALFRIPYDEVYASTPPALRPLFIALLVFILILLFCSISITASDFFCPNLATVAAYLGLSETTAGVTLLAFGNGSPDVFSTFASVRSGTFGLAVGELIGAASFITSIVVGSIAMVRPFHVPRFAFMRDVFFFTVAVAILMLVLADGKLTLRESGGMVGLYVCYVGVVVCHNWYIVRKRRKAEYAELGWKHGEEQVEQVDVEAAPRPPTPIQHDSVPERLVPTPVTATRQLPFPRRASAASIAHTPYGDSDDDEIAADTQRAGYSLLGAVEFRDVVNTLRRQSLSPSSSRHPSRPSSPLPSPLVEHTVAHQFRHHRRSSSQAFFEETLSRRSSGTGRSRSGSMPKPRPGLLQPPSRPSTRRMPSLSDHRLEVVPSSPYEDPESPPHQETNSVALSPLPVRADSGPNTQALREALSVVIPPQGGGASDAGLSASPTSIDGFHRAASPGGVPEISVLDPAGEFELPIHPLTRTNTVVTLREVGGAIHRTLHVLFPSLQGFKHKSILGMALAVLSAPSIFCLTLTLPVVDDGRGDEGGIALPDGDIGSIYSPSPTGSRRSSQDLGPEEQLEHLVEEFSARPRHAHFESSVIVRSGSPCPSDDNGSEVISECDVLDFNPVLTAVQCILGPMSVIYLVFQDEWFLLPVLLLALGIGAGMAACVFLWAQDGTAQPWRLVRCCFGFVCAMVWIASIADEVVNVLQTFGAIFGLSDAIIGLTIFAVGNSLADLVANVTIAQFAPNMAYAACFGGPMLNLLLGVGGSGSYWILTTSHKAVTIDFSPTLWVSGLGLILVLMTTAVVVPLNRFFIDRRWALVLLIAYVTLMIVNVVVEVRFEGRD